MIIKNYTIEILISTLVLVLLFYSSNPVFYSDSSRYLYGSLKDPPLYFFIVTTMQSIFTTLNSVVILQTSFVGFGVIFITKSIFKYFNLNLLIKVFVALFLFLPILQFYNHLLTEPFSYAFSLLFVSFVLRLIYNFNIQNLVWCSIAVIALLLMRNQFIFLYPVILLLYLGILFIHRSKKKLILLTISFISIIFISNSLISLNKYTMGSGESDLQGRGGSPWGGTLGEKNSSGAFDFVYIDAIYISTIEDKNIFKDDDLRKTLTTIFQEADRQKVLLANYNGRGHFGFSSTVILHQSNFLLEKLAIKKNTTTANLKKEISIKLIKKNFKKYIKFIFKKFYDSSWLFVFFPFFMLLAAFPIFLKQKSNFLLFIVFISTFSLANHSLVYLFGRVQPRYLIYTDFILLIFIFIIFTILLKRNSIN